MATLSLNYLQFLERSKVSKVWQDKHTIYTICTSVFPCIPRKAHQITWTLRNMEPSFAIPTFYSDESRNKTSSIVVSFIFDGPDPLSKEKMCPDCDPYKPCRDLNIKTDHYTMYSYNLTKYLNDIIPRNSIIQEVGACNPGLGDYFYTIYTFSAGLKEESYIDTICEGVYDLLKRVDISGIPNIKHINIDILSCQGYTPMTTLLIASNYDETAQEIVSEEEKDQDAHSLESLISEKGYWCHRDVTLIGTTYNREMNILCSAYEAINVQKLMFYFTEDY